MRKEDSGMRCYAHVATGNYHTRTARLYEDVGLLTANPAVTRDVVNLFHFLTGRSRTPCVPDAARRADADALAVRRADRA